MNREEFDRIAKQAAENVKALRAAELERLRGVLQERLRQRLELEREAQEQGVTLPLDDELARLTKKIGNWPA